MCVAEPANLGEGAKVALRPAFSSLFPGAARRHFSPQPNWRAVLIRLAAVASKGQFKGGGRGVTGSGVGFIESITTDLHWPVSPVKFGLFFSSAI